MKLATPEEMVRDGLREATIAEVHEALEARAVAFYWDDCVGYCLERESGVVELLGRLE
jgi:hypothetical protein